MEVWKAIPGYEGRYEASSWGRVRSLDRVDRAGARRKGRMLRIPNTPGYQRVGIEGKNYLVHRLVLAAFKGEADPGIEGNHIDGNKVNNRIDNLEWVTRSQNTRHAFEVLGRDYRGEHNPHAVLTENLVRAARAAYTGKYGEVIRLARNLGVPYGALSQALSGRSWTHI